MENTFKGTKGKWIYKPTQRTNGKIDVFRVYPIDKQGFFDSGICPVKNDTEESEYNALLISKAPEMLEMLKRIVYNLENEECPFDEDEIKKLIKEATEL